MFPEPMLADLMIGPLAGLSEGQRPIAHLVVLLAVVAIASLVYLIRRVRRRQTRERQDRPE